MNKPLNRKEGLLWIMVSASLCLMVYTTVRNEAARRRTPKLAAEIPTGTNIGGLQVTDTHGIEKTIPAQGTCLIAFLDTQCGPCQQQVAVLNQATASGRFNAVVAVFGEAISKVTEFEASVRPAFACLVDTGHGPMSEHPITTYPQIVELKDGVVMRSWVGYHDKLE
jgi:hypothetical protein